MAPQSDRKSTTNIDNDNDNLSVISCDDGRDAPARTSGFSPRESESELQIQALIEQLRDKENALDCTQQLVQNLMAQVERLQLENEQLRREQSQRPSIERSSANNDQDPDPVVVPTKLGPTSGVIPRPPSCASFHRLISRGFSDSSLTTMSQRFDLMPGQESQLGDPFALRRDVPQPSEAVMTTAASGNSHHGIRRPPSCASGLRLLYGGMSVSSFSTINEHERSIENLQSRVVVESMPHSNAEMFQLRRNSDNIESHDETPDPNRPSESAPTTTTTDLTDHVARIPSIPSSARIPRGFSTSSISTISEGTSLGIRRRRDNCSQNLAPRKRSSTNVGNVRAMSARAHNSDRKNEDWGDALVAPPSNSSSGGNALLRKAKSLDPNF